MSQEEVNEVVVEGLTPEDFILMSQIIEKYPMTVTYNNHSDVRSLYLKINEIVSYLQKTD